MTVNQTTAATPTRAELDAIVAEADMGGRKPVGAVARLISVIAISWSLFQLWYASPLPFSLNIGIFNDTEARAFHLCFAFVLAFLAFPAFATSSRSRVPLGDWVLAGLAVCSVLYLVIFYQTLSQRPGLPTTADVVVSIIGILLLLEASRRAEGPWMPVIAIAALIYVFTGPWLPGMMAHKGVSISRAASHFWITSEGVFGVALGVATNFIFLFVLFGALLERAGAGNWFIQVAFSLLGRYRGGPAKAAVVASGMTGMISGSSVANVVTTGTFTIPLMKRVGYTPVQAGGIECAAGVNGQLMPPVMGAAAFLMAEYVGISYAEVCRHALIPALLTFGALFYVVDLEATKAKMSGIPVKSKRTLKQGAIAGALTIASLVILANVVSLGLGWSKELLGEHSGVFSLVVAILAYVALVWVRAKSPDLPIDDPNSPLVTVPDFYEAARTGLHYLIPVVILIWCLIIEELSPGLAALWGVLSMAAVVLTQGPLTSFFRGQPVISAQWGDGVRDVLAGFETGARNMIGIGVATATAGILVGAVTLTGVGLVMTEIVEFLSGGSLVITLVLVGLICIVLGTGLPTTASYVVVATLMAPVVVALAAQNDLAVPLIAVHMFVFYFGLMADVTPPVGLAAYAAGAISGADPMKVGWQGTWYEFRTVLLPFIFIFNPQILMIDIEGWGHLMLVVSCAAVAMMAFCAAFQGYFLTRSSVWETGALLLVCFTLFRPDFWMDQIIPPRVSAPATEIARVIDQTEGEGTLRVRIRSTDINGDEFIQTARLTLGAEGDTSKRLNATGLTLSSLGAEPLISAVRPGSEAARLKLRPGDQIESVLVPNPRPQPFLFAIPALALLGLVVLSQLRRRRSEFA